MTTRGPVKTEDRRPPWSSHAAGAARARHAAPAPRL